MASTVESEWLAAVDDAGFQADQLRLYEAPGAEAADGYGAVYWSPDTIVTPNDTTPDSLRALVDAAAADDQVHRFGVWRDNPAPILAALLRHELEHARQWERHGNAVFLLQQALIPALKEKSGGRGFGYLCNLSPLEMDANAAAARFAWDRHHDALTDALDANAVSPSHEGLLRYRGGPEAIDTLSERLIAFGHLFAERCERLAGAEGCSYAEKLEECWPGRGRRVWERLMKVGT